MSFLPRMFSAAAVHAWENGVWTHKPFSGNVGSFGLILDGSDGFNDVSGNGHHFGAFNGVQLDQNDLPPFI